MNCSTILSSIFGGEGGPTSCGTSEGECCCVKYVRMVKDKFDFDVTESDKGISINIGPKDPSKVKALQSLLRGIKGLCGECCSEEESQAGKTDKECCPK